MPSPVDLSVVIPAYDDAARLGPHLAALLPWLASSGRRHEVIVVDDGSRDGTAALVEALAAQWRPLRLVRLPRNRGKGCAVRTGMLAATGAMRLFVDADGAIPMTELEPLAGALRAGADVAIGAKRPSRSVRLARRVASRVFGALVRALVLPGVRDSQCGFKLFSAAAAESIFARQRLDGFCFDVEVLLLARERGWKVAEVEVEWRDVARGRVRLVRDALAMTRDLLRLRRRAAGSRPERPECDMGAA